MKCLRSGYCCIHLDVMIVDNPDLGVVEGNVIHKPTGTSCQHLQGPKAGEYACAVHDRDVHDVRVVGRYGLSKQGRGCYLKLKEA